LLRLFRTSVSFVAFAMRTRQFRGHPIHRRRWFV
jgi:hypothetical protein